MKIADLLETQHRKVLAILKQVEDGADPAALIRQLAHDLAAQMATEGGRSTPDRSAAEREPDGGYSKSHGYGAAHGGPTGPDDAPAAIPDPIQNDPSASIP
jgi:hypothetical protein